MSKFRLPDMEVLGKCERMETALGIPIEQAARTWAANEWNNRAYEIGTDGCSDIQLGYQTAVSLAEDLYLTLRKLRAATIDAGKK